MPVSDLYPNLRGHIDSCVSLFLMDDALAACDRGCSLPRPHTVRRMASVPAVNRSRVRVIDAVRLNLCVRRWTASTVIKNHMRATVIATVRDEARFAIVILSGHGSVISDSAQSLNRWQHSLMAISGAVAGCLPTAVQLGYIFPYWKL